MGPVTVRFRSVCIRGLVEEGEDMGRNRPNMEEVQKQWGKEED